MRAGPLPEHGTILPLWPGLAPGTPADFGAPRVTDLSGNPFFPDRELTRISCPTLTVLRPERPNGAAVIVAPGGGYSRISVEQEGRSTARWLLSLGVTVFLMTYRLPDEGHANGADVPLQDAQRAVRLVRSAARCSMMSGFPARSSAICWQRSMAPPSCAVPPGCATRWASSCCLRGFR